MFIVSDRERLWSDQPPGFPFEEALPNRAIKEVGVGGDATEVYEQWWIAVLEVEGVHEIMSKHPMFFQWVQDPIATVHNPIFVL